MDTTSARKRGALLKIAATQHGVVTRVQAEGCGFSVSAMARAVERGDWDRLFPGLFLVDPAANPIWARAMAATLRRPGRVWVSHRSAAGLWGMGDVGAPIWPDVSTTANLRTGRGTIHHVSAMDASDRSVRLGVPVTGPDRTLIDLATVLRLARLETVVLDAVRKGMTSPQQLQARATDLASPGRSGPRAILEVVERLGGGSLPESALELALLRLIRGHPGLPPPRRQWEIRDRGLLVARVDFAYPERMVAIEADGYRWHSDPVSWRRDLKRRNKLTAAGWHVLHFTWEDVHRRPEEVAQSIADAISCRFVPESGTKRRGTGIT